MSTRFFEQQLPGAGLELIERWAQRPGSILLRQPSSEGDSVLYFAPRWRVRLDADRPPDWGDCPLSLDLRHPLEWPFRLSSHWGACPGQTPCGLVGQLSYELGARAEGFVHATPLPLDFPELWLGLFDAALIFGGGRIRLAVADLSPLYPSPRSLEDLWERRAKECLDAPPLRMPGARVETEFELPDPAWHGGAVLRIQDYLRRGHIYQANLTAQIRARSADLAWPLFVQEFERNPTEFAAFLRLEDSAVSCFSPERLLRLRDGWLSTSPIKGTMATAERESLRSSAKDRAEHVMIVDLCRNDLGRVCEYGSIRVDSLMRELELRGLVHLVSDIRGRLRPGEAARILPSLFPGGSITGAPKRRAMEIIDEVECSRRGVYTGSIGVVRADGRSDWNIAIRTAIWQAGQMSFGCGGGIVLDSDPEREYEEALLKARSFLEALRSCAPQSEAASA